MLAGLVVAVVTFVASAGCAKKQTPEEQIRKMLDDGVAALEERDAKKAADALADDYLDKRGRDKDKLKAYAFFGLQQGPVLVSLQAVNIVVDGDNADVSLKALAVQGNPDLKTAADLLPSNAQTFDLKLKVAKKSGAWKVTAIDGLGFGGGMD